MKMKTSLVFAFAILFLVTNSIFISAITGSMGNARMILYPEVNGFTNTVLDKTILVKNVNDVAINVTLVPDANASKFIDIIDNTFILQPGEENKAQFQVKVKKVGTYQGQINVFFRPAEGTEGGVVLSSTIIVIARKNQKEYNDNGSDNTDNTDNTSGNETETPIESGDGKTGLSTPVIIFGISTIVLLLILLLLLYIWSKKRNKSKRKKNKYR